MTVDELEEYEAFYQLEPFGTPAEDDRWRLLYMLTHKAHFDQKNVDHSVWLDRDPEETARLRAQAEAALTVEDRIEMFFLAHGVVEADEDDPSV